MSSNTTSPFLFCDLDDCFYIMKLAEASLEDSDMEHEDECKLRESEDVGDIEEWKRKKERE